MVQQLRLHPDAFDKRAISPLQELGAYEALGMEPKFTFKSLSRKFQDCPGALPSDLISVAEAQRHAASVREALQKANVRGFGAGSTVPRHTHIWLIAPDPEGGL